MYILSVEGVSILPVEIFGGCSLIQPFKISIIISLLSISDWTEEIWKSKKTNNNLDFIWAPFLKVELFYDVELLYILYHLVNLS